MKNTNEMVLLYNMDSDKGRKIKFVLIRLGVRIKNISKAQFNQPLGALAGIKEFSLLEEEFKGDAFEDEMMVMKGLSSTKIDQIILQFRKNGIEKINLKAVITPTNQSWNSLELYEEIKQEHEEMTTLMKEQAEKKK